MFGLGNAPRVPIEVDGEVYVPYYSEVGGATIETYLTYSDLCEMIDDDTDDVSDYRYDP